MLKSDGCRSIPRSCLLLSIELEQTSSLCCMMFHHIISLPIFLIFIQTEVSAVNTGGVTFNCGFKTNFPPNVDLQTFARHCDRVFFLTLALYSHDARFISTRGQHAFSLGNNPLKNNYKNIIIHESARENIVKLKKMDRKVLLEIGMYTTGSHIQEIEYKANLKKLLAMARDLQYDGIYFTYTRAEVATNFLTMLIEVDYTTIWPGMELDFLVRAHLKPYTIPWDTFDKMITNYIFGFANGTMDVIEPFCPFNLKHPRDMTRTLPEYKSLDMSKAIVMMHPGMKSYFRKDSEIKDVYTTDMKTTCYLLHKSQKVKWDLSRSTYTEAVSKTDQYVLFVEDLTSMKTKFDYVLGEGMKGVGIFVQFSKHAVRVPQCDNIYGTLLRALKYYVDDDINMMTKLGKEMDELLYNPSQTSSKNMSNMILDIKTQYY